MDKDIFKYLHYYIGHTAMHPGLKNPQAITGRWMQSMIEKRIPVRPILRRLESLTDEEIKKGNWGGRRQFNYYMEGNQGAFHPGDFHYLLSLGIDLFGLIDAGLAIDKATIKS